MHSGEVSGKVSLEENSSASIVWMDIYFKYIMINRNCVESEK